MSADATCPLFERRRAGLLVPLASLRRERAGAIGDLGDLRALIDWAAAQSLSVVQLLPVSPISPTAPFPYSAYSAFGLDLTIVDVEHPVIRQSPAAQARLSDMAEPLRQLSEAPRLQYEEAFRLKSDILAAAHSDWRAKRPTRRFVDFERASSAWLPDFALFSALKEDIGWRVPWTEWPQELKERRPPALEAARRRLAERLSFFAFAQWLAHEQWQAVREHAKSKGVLLMGDMPIYAAGDSVDRWAHRDQFDTEADGGAPPDYFDWRGQNWAAPLYDWERMKADGFSWWRRRVAYNAELFDALRFDHFRGISEYWRIPKHPAILDEIARETDKPRLLKEYEKVAWFWPIKFNYQFREKLSEDEWTRLSDMDRLNLLKHINAEWVAGPQDLFVEQVMQDATRRFGLAWVVEDLGADMDKVYALRDQFQLAGMRIAQFYGYDDKGRPNPHVKPSEWPSQSLAMTDTHDLPPLNAWLATLTPPEQYRIARDYGFAWSEHDGPEAFEKGIWRTLLNAPSQLVLFSLQTLLGLGAEDRINTPGTVGPANWTWRMPVPIERLALAEWKRAFLTERSAPAALSTTTR